MSSNERKRQKLSHSTSDGPCRSESSNRLMREQMNEMKEQMDSMKDTLDKFAADYLKEKPIETERWTNILELQMKYFYVYSNK